MGWRLTFVLAVLWHLAVFSKACADHISRNLTADQFDENLFPVLLSASPLIINVLEILDCNATEQLKDFYDPTSNTYVIASNSCESICEDVNMSTKEMAPITLSNGLVLDIKSWRIVDGKRWRRHSELEKENDDVQKPMAIGLISPAQFNQWNETHRNIIFLLSPTVILSVLLFFYKKKNPFHKERHEPSSRPGSPMVTECDVRYNHLNERVKIV